MAIFTILFLVFLVFVGLFTSHTTVQKRPMHPRRRKRISVRSFQRSEVLDDDTCNFCLSMDGLVVKPNNTWSTRNTFCEGCRGIWVEIMRDEVDPPKITGVPKQIAQYFKEKPNALVQPLKAITRPGTPAHDYVTKRDTKRGVSY